MILTALLLAATPQPQRPPKPVAPDPCAMADRPGPYYLFVDAAPARQGARIGIAAMQGYPYNASQPPAACARDWRVSHPKWLRLAPDRHSVRIARNAPPGTRVTISYRALGQRVSAQLRIVAADAVLLNGTRRQQAIERCTRDAIGELAFGEQDFSVTYQPFESYKDYWGSYAFDTATGALKLTVTGGNFVPPDLDLEGTARFEGNVLVLDGFDLGDRNFHPERPATSCRYRF